MSETTPDAAERPIRVLLVEDLLEDAFLIRTLLQGAGPYEVVLAQDGDTATRLAEEEEWDLVVTDLNIPGADGLEVIRRARAAHPDLPIVATTAYSGPQWEDQAIRSGANDLVHKPIDRDELIRSVEEQLHRAAEGGAGRGRVILAVGAAPGDVEAGCGGSLLVHRDAGDSLVILVLGATDGADWAAEGPARAAETLGARLLPDETGGLGARKPAGYVAAVADGLEPAIVYAPSRRDEDPGRRSAYQVTLEATVSAGTFLCYETATTPSDFRPTLFRDISLQLEEKLQLLEGYGEDDGLPGQLRSGYVSAAARYWGRNVDYGLAEAFESIRSEEEE